MAAAKMIHPAQAPKVELRSRTGAGYNRAGVRWTGEWQEVPAEIMRDEVRSKELRQDPHLDVRVNGKRIPKNASEAEAIGNDEEISRLKARISELENATKRTAIGEAPPPPAATPPAPASEPGKPAAR